MSAELLSAPSERPCDVNSPHRGVMDSSYSCDRTRKAHVKFRYKARARMVACKADRFLRTDGSLSVLDFGCAEGLTLLEICRLLPVTSAIGVEYSEDMLKFAPPIPEPITLLRGDVLKLPREIPAGHFDLVTALAFLEHIADPIQATKEAFRVLRPGGLFIATCPKPFWDGLSAHAGLHSGDEHLAHMDRKGMVHALEHACFEVIDFASFMFAPIAFIPYLRIGVSPALAQRIDEWIRPWRLFDFLFVNQCIVGRKTL